MDNCARGLLFILLFFAYLVGAEPSTCFQFYVATHSTYRSHQIKNLDSRLEKYFGLDWKKPVELSDADSAKLLLAKLEKFGTPLDLKFFDVYLGILESTSGFYEVRTPGFYIDMLMGERPKSNFFQERHWDWNILDGYFFNGPLAVSVVKNQDLKYLEHILNTAQKMGKTSTLKEVLQQGNHTWALKDLGSSPELLARYQSYIGGKSYDELYLDFRNKIEKWVEQGGKSKETRMKQVREAVDAFANSNSKLDLFLISKYFDLIKKFGVASKYWPHESIPKWLQLTDWRVYEMALPYPSMHYMTDFLFQNSHDAAAKEYLLDILTQMEKLKVEKYGDIGGFYFKFLDARSVVDKRRLLAPVPINYQNDLRIFSTRLTPGSGDRIRDFDQTLLTWNPSLRRLQANVIFSKQIDSQSSVETDPQLVASVRAYFDTLRKKGTLTEPEIVYDQEAELKTPLALTTFLSFTRPGSDRMLSLIRIFDGTNEKTFIEKEFPNISLRRLSNGRRVLELGRLFSSHVLESESFMVIMAGVAEYLKMANITADLYFDCNRAAMQFYRSKSAQTVFTPQHLNIPVGGTSLWVMKYTSEDIIRIFSQPEYKSVKTRK